MLKTIVVARFSNPAEATLVCAVVARVCEAVETIGAAHLSRPETHNPYPTSGSVVLLWVFI